MPVRPSSRLPPSLEPNALARARAALGPIPFDLTVSNPTACGLRYPPDLLAPLSHPRGLTYRPDPRGPERARRAVAEGYRSWGAEVDPETVVLTASTSESYSLLLKLLADPGEAVLAPAPSYPLVEHLARLEGVATHPLRLDPDWGWRLDRESVSNAPAGSRAAVLVHPNNPTGSYVHPEDASWLEAECRERGWALVVDEVFLPFPLDGGPGADASFAGRGGCLTFVLGGLSKSGGLPQVKLGWIVAAGPGSEATAALKALEHVADAYLSVAGPVADAAPDLLAASVPVREQIAARVRANLAALRASVARLPAISVDPPGGGWSAVLRVPSVIDEEELALALLGRRGVAVQPGYFFDFDRPGRLVLSLLPREDLFEEGVDRLLDELGERIAAL